MRVFRYFAGLSAPQIVLWCYLGWYLAVVARHFDPDPALWLSSLGIAGIVGYALVLSTGGWRAHWPPTWTTFRLFLMPFCVSSYAVLIKGRGFVLLFPTTGADVAACLGAVAAFLVAQRVCRLAARGR